MRIIEVAVAIMGRAMFCASLTAAAYHFEAPVLNPRSYTSPSGQFVLHVDPSDLYGRGGADYRVTLNGRTVWAGVKPFTLCEASITDEGLIGGYAYTHGIEGFPKLRGSDRPGEFHVVVMRATGELVVDDKVKRTPSRFLHALPNPLAKGILIDGVKNRLIVLVADEDLNRRKDSWWTYELSSEKPLGKFKTGPAIPSSNQKGTEKQIQALDVAALPNRPLKQLGVFKLDAKSSPEASAIRDVVSFDVDDRERIGFHQTGHAKGIRVCSNRTKRTALARSQAANSRQIVDK